MNRTLLLALDKTLSRVLFWLIVAVEALRPGRGRQPLEIGLAARRFLVIRPGGLGDGLMTIPFLRCLKRAFPDGHVTLVCVQKNRAAFRTLPFLDDILVLDDSSRMGHNLARLAARYDVLFDLEPFRRTSAVIGWLSRARIRVGFDTNSRRHLFTHLVSYAGDSRFEGANMLHQLRVLGIDSPYEEAADMSLDLPESARAGAKQVLKSHGVNLQRDFLVAVAVGVLKPHHRWLTREYVELIRLIRRDDVHVRVVLVGSANDVDETDEVIRALGQPEDVVNLAGKTDVVTAMGMLECCRMLIASDGGLVYMAAAVGCSTISLWGPGVMERFKPPGQNHVGVRKSYPCIPCVTWDRLGEFPACPYDRRCYNDLRALEVFDAYRRLKHRLTAVRATA